MLEKIQKALTEIGVSIYHYDGTVRNFNDILRDISNAWEKLTDDSKVGIVELLK